MAEGLIFFAALVGAILGGRALHERTRRMTRPLVVLWPAPATTVELGPSGRALVIATDNHNLHRPIGTALVSMADSATCRVQLRLFLPTAAERRRVERAHARGELQIAWGFQVLESEHFDGFDRIKRCRLIDVSVATRRALRPAHA